MRRYLLIVLLSPLLGRTADPVSSEVFVRIPRDGGFCEARVRMIHDAGCLIRGESEYVESATYVDVDEGMGERFVDCGAESVVCRRPYFCDCGRRTTRRDGGEPKIAWDAVAFRWVGEVGHPQLERCARSAGAEGQVLLRISQSGAIALEVERGNAALKDCAAVLRASWGATRVSGGYVVRLSLPDQVPVGDQVEWREGKPPFSPCVQFMDCGAGQVCLHEIGADAGVCFDTLAAWRFRATLK